MMTFDKRAADALADEVAVLVRRGVIDARSPAADALLDYRDPPSSPRADRLAAVEAERDETRDQVVRLQGTIEKQLQPDLCAERAEVRRLRGLERFLRALEDENELLRALIREQVDSDDYPDDWDDRARRALSAPEPTSLATESQPPAEVCSGGCACGKTGIYPWDRGAGPEPCQACRPDDYIRFAIDHRGDRGWPLPQGQWVTLPAQPTGT